MRPMTPSDVARVYGAFWERAWRQPGLVEALSQAGSGALSFLAELAAEVTDYASPDTVPLDETRSWTLLQFTDRDIKRELVKVGSIIVGSFQVGALESPFAWSVPCPYAGAALVADSPHKPEVVLSNTSDFAIVGGRLVLTRDPTSLPLRATPTMHEDGAAGLVYGIWLYRSRKTTDNLNKYFGSMLRSSAPSTEEARRVLVAAWRLLVEGPNDLRVNQMLAALAGFDVPETAGTVLAVWDENGRRCVRVDDKIYSAAIPDGVLDWDATVVVGDQVEAGKLLFNSVSVVTDMTDPEAPAALRLSHGMVAPLEGVILENGLVPMTFEMIAANSDYTAVWDDTTHVLTVTGPDYAASVYNPDFETLLDMGVAKVPSFRAGDEDAAAEWRRSMAESSVALGVDLWAWATTGLNYPYYVNPLTLVLSSGVGQNIMLVSFKESCAIDQAMLDLGFKWLVRCLPAGTIVAPLLASSGEEDACDPADSQLDVFLVPAEVVESISPDNSRMSAAGHIY